MRSSARFRAWSTSLAEHRVASDRLIEFDYGACMFTIEISREFAARQGLPSPVRRARGVAVRSPEEPFEVELRVGFSFEDVQLGDRGWFIDTDELDTVIDAIVVELTAGSWTESFPFRATFELVSRWVFERLTSSVPQLSYVQLTNLSLSVSTRYSAD